jgi:hypothetical protein
MKRTLRASDKDLRKNPCSKTPTRCNRDPTCIGLVFWAFLVLINKIIRVKIVILYILGSDNAKIAMLKCVNGFNEALWVNEWNLMTSTVSCMTNFEEVENLNFLKLYLRVESFKIKDVTNVSAKRSFLVSKVFGISLAFGFQGVNI